MRVVQVIDTLRPGGAENMAVNLANLLSGHVEASFLCCTRSSGNLEERLSSQVGFICLNKRSSLDFKALFKFRKFIEENRISLIHAHSTSYFFSVLLKILTPKVKLIWHDHYGESEFIQNRRDPVLKFLSRYFSGVLVVNGKLGNWVKTHLHVKKVEQIKNFVTFERLKDNSKEFEFYGEKDSFRLVCVANLRPQKNHLILIQAIEELRNPDISLHLFGEDPKTNYSIKVLDRIKNSEKANSIYYYGSNPDIDRILPKAQVGILPSRSEGLPLVLLEYALSGIPVICTRVGENEELIGDFGKIVEPNNISALVIAIKEYYRDHEKRKNDSKNLRSKIQKEYNPEIIRNKLLQFYKQV